MHEISNGNGKIRRRRNLIARAKQKLPHTQKKRRVSKKYCDRRKIIAYFVHWKQVNKNMTN